MTTRAIILAAGRGRRMGRDRAKVMLPCCGQPLASYQLTSLDRCGIKEIAIVTGYRAGEVKRYTGSKVTVIYNPHFASSNSAYSLWLARDWIDGNNFVLLNGDVVAESSLFADLLDCASFCAALVDDTKPLVEGEANVVIENGKITQFSESLPTHSADAQSAQLIKFGAHESRLLVDNMARMRLNRRSGHFPSAAFEPICQGGVMRPVYTNGRRWFDNDTPEDLEACADYVNRNPGLFS